MTKIALVTGSLNLDAGGVYTAVADLATEISRDNGISVTVLGVSRNASPESAKTSQPFKTLAARQFGPNSFAFSPDLYETLRSIDPDIVHVHGLWMFSSLVVERWSRVFGRPYIVSPHGMLDAWALAQSGWKKHAAAFLYERRHLRHAACVQALTSAEAQDIRLFGVTSPICIIPNGVRIRPAKPRQMDPRVRRFVYLGRLHPKKGLEPLITAWSMLTRERSLDNSADPVELIIAGAGDPSYERRLRDLAEYYRVEASLRLIGPVIDREKARLLSASDALVLPSVSEGLPMAVIEALSEGVPCIITRACNIQDSQYGDSTIIIEPNVEGIVYGLKSFLDKPPEERERMSRCALRLVSSRYCIQETTRCLREVYDWSLGRAAGPETLVSSP